MVSFQDLLNIPRQNVLYGPNYDIKNSLIFLWMFVICYSLSTKANVISPSLASLLGMYYMMYDVLSILKNRIVAALKNDDEAVEGEELPEEEVVEDEDDDQKTIIEEDDEDEVIEDENAIRHEKALRQLADYAYKIQQMNEQRKAVSEEDYSDLPPLVPEYNLREPGHYAPSAEAAQI